MFRNESFVMEDNLVEDVSRGANLVVEGMERNRDRETTSVEDPRQQEPFGSKLPRDTSSRRESKERQEEICKFSRLKCESITYLYFLPSTQRGSW